MKRLCRGYIIKFYTDMYIKIKKSQTYGKNQRGRPKARRLCGIHTGMKERN
jgi:hypothetical protein